MKLKPLENYSENRIAIGQVRGADGRPFSVEPGEVGYLTPAAYAHPLVKRFLGAGLRDYVESAPPPADEPEPIAPPDLDEGKDVRDDGDDEDEGDDTRALYITAPGITEGNVDAVLEAFPTLDELANAEKDALIEAGVSKSFTSRLLEWTTED